MNLTIQATFVNLNIRTELAGDGPGVTAVDIALSTSLLRGDFAALFANAAECGLLHQALWREDGGVRGHAIRHLKITRQFGDVTATIGITDLLVSGDVTLQDCQLNKISFSPEAGGVADVKFRLQGHPTTAQIGQLSRLLGRDVDVTIEAQATATSDNGQAHDGELALDAA